MTRRSTKRTANAMKPAARCAMRPSPPLTPFGLENDLPMSTIVPQPAEA
mgnify:CR=1 FL=1